MRSAENDDQIGRRAGGQVYQRLGGDLPAADPAGMRDQPAQAAGSFGRVPRGIGEKLLRHVTAGVGALGIEEPGDGGGANAFEAGRGHHYDYNAANQ